MMKFKKKTQCLFAFIIAVVMLFIGVSSPSYVYATARNELFQYWNLDDGTDLESYIDSLILHENVFS